MTTYETKADIDRLTAKCLGRYFHQVRDELCRLHKSDIQYVNELVSLYPTTIIEHWYSHTSALTCAKRLLALR